MMQPDLRTTRTYYWTWQACSLCAAIAAGAGTSLIWWLSVGGLGFVGGILVGAVTHQAWQQTKFDSWRDRRPDTWHPDRRRET